MKISVLQPEIERGNINKNTAIIQKLINEADGGLLVLAEYALTGSLVLENNVDIQKWVAESEMAKRELSIPENKRLLINSLIIKGSPLKTLYEIRPKSDKIGVGETKQWGGRKHAIRLFNRRKNIQKIR